MARRGSAMTGASLDHDRSRHRPKTANLLVNLLIEREGLRLEIEALREKNAELRAILTGGDPPESPFPLLSGAEIINILHPEQYRR